MTASSWGLHPVNVLLLVNVSSWTSSVSALTTPPLRPRVRMCVHFRFVTVKKGEVAVTFDAGNLKLLGAVCMPPTHRRKKTAATRFFRPTRNPGPLLQPSDRHCRRPLLPLAHGMHALSCALVY